MVAREASRFWSQLDSKNRYQISLKLICVSEGNGLMKPINRTRLRAILFALSFFAVAGRPAHADISTGQARNSWITVTAENNNFGGNQDYNYVNGFNVSVLLPIQTQGGSIFQRAAGSIFDKCSWLFASAGETDRRFEWTILGQQIYTPADKDRAVPDPNDRPYAAWLYTGLDLLQDSNAERLDDLFITLGVVGPVAMGRQVQTGFHKVLGFGSVNGWKY